MIIRTTVFLVPGGGKGAVSAISVDTLRGGKR